ncbi:hypothetical protein CVU83_02935 [Candidatus Falkowbacteria bacterium HGW-Falkowbacteria-2]|uniref:Uncharacterized protein n=1 Tax=Candidatus Falkowbacteria bacterium HGW-Falkowbacteria-2 TaxID=2013769 RepID=A0A2N2DYH0_9BACT|nr:MAG: hypothetical protein CVU83_02935 [Candidatus Falkowbacteria bacterium HGW-Falkowbacteria-2]
MANNNLSNDTRNIFIAVAVVVVIGLVVIWFYRPFEPISNNQPGNQNDNGNVVDNEDNGEDEAAEREREEQAVRETVLTLGERLKNVSLLSPNVNSEIRDNFRDLVTTELLSEWQARPELAPGRLVSTPIPDRIEIRSLQRQAADRYRVDADIVEVASGSTGSEGESRRGIALTLIKIEDRWVISSASLAPYDASDNWLSANQSGVRFRYPASLGTKYISTQVWPPLMKIETDTDFACAVNETDTISGELVRNTTINGREYCIRTRGEGAAGSTYNSYDYATLTGDRLITASFSIRYPQCSNYGAEEATACSRERADFDLDSLVDRVIRTVE